MRTITYRGETFGEGTDIGLRSLRGLEALEVEELGVDLPRYHGGIPTAAYGLARRIEVELNVKPSTRARALSAFQPEVDTEQPLVIVWEDEAGVALTTERVECRVARRGGPSRDRNSEFAGSVLVVQLEAQDPAIYDNTLLSETLPPFVAAGGFSWPIVWPLSWGASGTGGSGTITNTGDWETWPTFTINGPSTGTLTNPIIESVTAGEKLALNANGGVSMTPGQQLIIETHPARRSIAFSTGASRRGKLSDDSTWFPLEPGVNDLRFRASGTTTDATVLVEARSARI